MQDKPKTARFGTTLFLDNPLHRQAWELLSAIPAGQRTNWLCLALCQQAQRKQFLLDLKTILQTELQNRLAELILEGKVEDGATILASVKGESLSFAITPPQGKAKAAA